MHSRAGAQVPFSSINFDADTSPEGRMVSEKLMLAREAGLGNGETPIFDPDLQGPKGISTIRAIEL
ncbi:MAG: anaerobic ribonucleoside-triphosphate reductase [Merdibacter sp.]